MSDLTRGFGLGIWSMGFAAMLTPTLGVADTYAPGVVMLLTGLLIFCIAEPNNRNL